MATERITIQVESNIGEDGPLTVMDTLHQFMDAFELIAAAVAQESGGEKIKWRLERLSKNSPATAVAIAYSADPSVVVGPLVYHGKRRLSSAIEDLGSGNVAPWLRDKSNLAKSLLRRNLNGIGRTIFDFDDDAPRTVLVEKNSRRALKSIESFEANKDEEDRSRSEFGSLDAYVAEAKTYHGKPAIYVKDRLSGRIVPCVLNDRLAEHVGQTHSWHDTWSGKRVRVKGQLFFDKSGQISRISAIGLEDVAMKQIELRKLQDLNILQGKSPVEHLDSIWGTSND
jgi:hypothetical protein